MSAADPRSKVAYQAREPGWYLVDTATGLALSGPFDQQLTASRIMEAAQRRWTDRGMDPLWELGIEHIHPKAAK